MGRLTIDTLAGYLGRPIAAMLAAAPFSGWRYDRSVETDLDEIIVDYVSDDGGMDVVTDSRGNVGTIFLYFGEARRFAGELAEISPASTREQAAARFGPPSKSGERSDDPILGRTGPWDRFRRTEYTLHLQYDFERDAVAQVTLMRPDLVP